MLCSSRHFHNVGAGGFGVGHSRGSPPVVTDVGISLFLPRAPWPLTHRAMHATGVRSLFFSDTTSCAVVVASRLKKEKMYWYVMRLVCPSVCVSVCLSVCLLGGSWFGAEAAIHESWLGAFFGFAISAQYLHAATCCRQFVSS